VKECPKNWIAEQVDWMYQTFASFLEHRDNPADCEKWWEDALHIGIELTDLEMSFKLLRFNVLERRMTGLSQLRRFVTEWAHLAENTYVTLYLCSNPFFLFLMCLSW
jgi:hypothetical protein